MEFFRHIDECHTFVSTLIKMFYYLITCSVILIFLLWMRFQEHPMADLIYCRSAFSLLKVKTLNSLTHGTVK
jgi:hypothetical protein